LGYCPDGAGKAGSPSLCALSRTPLWFTRFSPPTQQPSFWVRFAGAGGYRRPAPPKIMAVAVLLVVLFII